MNWDPALLRKFSSTGHFRLLNQLKNELIKRGLNRDQTTGELRMPGYGSRFGRRGGTSREAVNSAKEIPATTPEPAAVPVRETPGSFRQRLNAIDMR